jgi:hypothetical protein
MGASTSLAEELTRLKACSFLENNSLGKNIRRDTTAPQKTGQGRSQFPEKMQCLNLRQIAHADA